MPKTYNDLYLETRRVLREKNIAGSDLEARILVGHAAEKSTEALLRDMRLYAADETVEKLDEMLLRRLEGEPVAYITGSWEFYGLPMEVDESVLIPRVDTEVLVETAIDTLTGWKMDARILDLCCGSGCIGCAIAKEMPATRVVMADISRDALRVSKRNVLINDLTPRVSCIEVDALKAPPMFMGSFDLIVSNPPYIPAGDIPGLDASVRDYEPVTALDGGADGLDFYRAITAKWKEVLRPGGVMMFEVGIRQAQDVAALMREAGFRGVETAYDTCGIERVVYGHI